MVTRSKGKVGDNKPAPREPKSSPIAELLRGPASDSTKIKARTRGPITLYLDRSLFTRFREQCERHDLSPSQAIEKWMGEVMGESELA